MRLGGGDERGASEGLVGEKYSNIRKDWRNIPKSDLNSGGRVGEAAGSIPRAVTHIAPWGGCARATQVLFEQMQIVSHLTFQINTGRGKQIFPTIVSDICFIHSYMI